MHPKNRCYCEVDPANAKAVEAHAATCEKRPESFDYCDCKIDQDDSDEAKAQRAQHLKECGRKPRAQARLVRHGKDVASEEVKRCRVCSISDQELKDINSGPLTQVKGVYLEYACPAHSDCYFDPTNFWSEGDGEAHRVVARDAQTGEIIDPSARKVIRPDYLQKATAEEASTDEQDG